MSVSVLFHQPPWIISQKCIFTTNSPIKMVFEKKWKTGCGDSCGIANQTDVSQVVGIAAAL